MPYTTTCLRAALAAAIAWAVAAGETVDLVFQNGLDHYRGAADVFLYSPASVANVNFGRATRLHAGVNRWGERLATIMRFDLRDLPPGTEVNAARLSLRADSTTYPFRPIRVEVHELTPANADWIEGENVGTRSPVPGTPCWNFRRYDTAKWAGRGGAMRPGVDFSTAWSANAKCPAKARQWIDFVIPAHVARRWIDRPETNYGLHIYPGDAKEKGTVFVCASSDCEATPKWRPKLTVSVEGADALSRYRLAVVARSTAEARRRLARFVEKAKAAGMPMRTVERLGRPQARLEAVERFLELSQGMSSEAQQPVMSRIERVIESVDSMEMLLHVDCAADANERRGLAPDFALGVQSAMKKVIPLEVPFDGEYPNDLILGAARNEYEHAQIVIVPIDEGLRRVHFVVSDLRGEKATIAPEHLSLHPVGFVESSQPHVTDSRQSATAPWWPDPILSHRESLEVAKGVVQPLWLTVYVPPGTPAGVYVGIVAVEAETMKREPAEPKGIKLILEVFDFDVPVQQHLRTIWGMTEQNWSRFYKGRYDEDFARKYVDLFLAHRMSVADLYRTKPTAQPDEDSLYHLANPTALRALRARGSAWWNIGHVLSPEHALKPSFGMGKTYPEYLAKCVDMFRAELARVDAAGWPHDAAGIYFLDETKDMASLALAAKTMKQHFPDIALMTTAYHRGYGLTGDEVDGPMDIWTPLTPRYVEDLAKIRDARARGKQAWWYICCGPRDAHALNWFVQTPLIRARLLMGAAAQKFKPDGFLYYRVAGWRDKNEVVGKSTSFIKWDPFYYRPDGDGTLIYPGPDGPLSTIRLDAIRDGLEDYEYYWILEQLVKKAEAKGLGRGRVVRIAKTLLAVPDEILASLSEYTEDPQALAAHRYGVAQTIQALRNAVR